VTPRAYAQDRRAGTTGATRARIIEAAMAVYRERGLEGARLAEIAARADVSRGTIVNHFGSGDGLLGAVIDEVLSTLEVPDELVLDGASSDEERIRRFLDAWLRFYDRSGEWWTVFADERHTLPAIPTLQAREQQFWENLARLQVAAVGSLAADRVFAATFAGFMQSTLLFTLRNAGLSLDEAIEVTTEMLLGVLHR
jgi:TetR/AcrR family transcriptional regulator, cholesterol catabolism regulator